MSSTLNPALRHQLLFLIAAPLAVGLGFAVVGPYGTYDKIAMPWRAVYWVLIVWANWLQVTFLAKGFIRLLPAPRWPVAVPVAIAACLASAAATLEVKGLNAWLMPNEPSGGLAELFFLVLVITLPLSFLVQRGGLAQAEQPAPVAVVAPPPAAPTPSRFLDRLPAKLGRELLCVKTEDHYLRVYTAAGDDLILMRMGDAEAELAPLAGLRVHRSWWVARSAVTAVERDGGRLTLVLGNGLKVPVARSASGALRAAGWPGA